jgi:hypothetical protein
MDAITFYSYITLKVQNADETYVHVTTAAPIVTESDDQQLLDRKVLYDSERDPVTS